MGNDRFPPRPAVTFSRVRTFIIALVIGVVVTLALGFGFGSMQAALFPSPPGASVGNPATTAAAVAMPLVAKLLLLAEWTITDLVAVGAAILANDGRKGVAWAAWIYPLLATVANYSEYPFPNWLMISGALACPLTALAAYQIVQAYERRPLSGTSNAPAKAMWDPPPYVINACWLGAIALVFPAVWFLWLPPDEQFGALIFKGLLLLVMGYAALMNGASSDWLRRRLDRRSEHRSRRQPAAQRRAVVSRVAVARSDDGPGLRWNCRLFRLALRNGQPDVRYRHRHFRALDFPLRHAGVVPSVS